MSRPSHTNDLAAYERRMMRSGPYYERRTKTLRIPHRGHTPRAHLARGVWVKYGMHWDEHRKEFYSRMWTPQIIQDQLDKARKVFKQLYGEF